MNKDKKHSNSELRLQPVILSGGKGSRLWPLSRECYPKQYLELDEKNNFSLLQNTYLRLNKIENLEPPIIICNEEQRFLVAEQMLEINIKPKSIILEPEGKNTAPAIALAALLTKRKDEDPGLIILSSDHIIEKPKEFKDSIIEGLHLAKQGKIVTFGVLPTTPESGYGYIESIEELSREKKSSYIKKFIEKPPIETAKKLIQDKKYTWNSGIFLFKTSVIINELNQYAPEILNICQKSLDNSINDLDFLRVNKKIFQTCPSISFDIAVMERTKNATVVRLDAGWNDVGSWESIWKKSIKDKNNNSTKGKILLNDSKGCYLRSESRLVVGLELEDLIVVDTDDALLIANKKSSQKVKDIVKDLKKKDIPEGKLNKKMFRPWGNYSSIIKGTSWKVKRLEIKPGSSLSLQMHHHRTEHWIIVEGIAKVEIDNKETLLKKNESIYVPKFSKHRLSNPGKNLLIIIEVQNGEYLGEDDIIRFEDIYGRDKSFD